jgi:DNA polymerase III delta prime subunit
MPKKQPVYLRKKEKPMNDPNSRAMLIHGPPGVGKTTTVRLLARNLNFDVLELNASDTRNKEAIERMLGELS